jgi:hypothetical protein
MTKTFLIPLFLFILIFIIFAKTQSQMKQVTLFAKGFTSSAEVANIFSVTRIKEEEVNNTKYALNKPIGHLTASLVQVEETEVQKISLELPITRTETRENNGDD